MPTCMQCNCHFPVWIKIDGKQKNLNNRKYCLDCSPFGLHNTRQIHLPPRIRRKLDYNHSRQKIVRNERRQKLIDIKGSCCEICGYHKTINALDFHHKDPATKCFGLSKATMTRHSWEKLEEEVKKTVLLCRNCHAEVHEGITYMVDVV